MHRTLYLATLMLAIGVQGQVRGQTGIEDQAYDLVRLATERNGDIAASRSLITEARGALMQAAIRPASSIEVTGLNGRPFGSTGEAEYAALYVHPVETAGKRDMRIQLAEKAVDPAEAELAERIRQLSAEIKFRYVDALAQSRRLEILNRLLFIDRESTSLLKARAEEGEIPRLDYELMLVDLSRLEAQRIFAAARANSSLFELRTLLGPEQSLVLSGELRILDVLNEQRRFIESQMDHIEAKAEAARAYYELERAIGTDLR